MASGAISLLLRRRGRFVPRLRVASGLGDMKDNGIEYI